MSNLKKKIRENYHRRLRENLLSELRPELSAFISRSEISSDVSKVKYALFSTWSPKKSKWVTTRGDLSYWEKRDFIEWSALTEELGKVTLPEGVNGWIFFDTDGPYFSSTSSNFIQYLTLILEYVEKGEGCDFGWVGDKLDCGLIVEFEYCGFDVNDFAYCIWNKPNQEP